MKLPIKFSHRFQPYDPQSLGRIIQNLLQISQFLKAQFSLYQPHLTQRVKKQGGIILPEQLLCVTNGSRHGSILSSLSGT